MLLFFDLGRKGAISYFVNFKFEKVENFEISKSARVNNLQKIRLWIKLLEKRFENPVLIKNVGFFYPFGKNRRTIVALTMLMTATILHFSNAKIHFVLEWEAWKFCLKRRQIPKRNEKKALTINWAKRYLKTIQQLTDDQADALLGGVFLLKTTFQKQN